MSSVRIEIRKLFALWIPFGSLSMDSHWQHMSCWRSRCCLLRHSQMVVLSLPTRQLGTRRWTPPQTTSRCHQWWDTCSHWIKPTFNSCISRRTAPTWLLSTIIFSGHYKITWVEKPLIIGRTLKSKSVAISTPCLLLSIVTAFIVWVHAGSTLWTTVVNIILIKSCFLKQYVCLKNKREMYQT